MPRFRLVALALSLAALAACGKSKDTAPEPDPGNGGAPKTPTLKAGTRPKIALKANEVLAVFARVDQKSGEVVVTKDGVGPETRYPHVKPAPKYVDGSPQRSEWNHPGHFDRNEVILVLETKEGVKTVTEIRLPPDRGKIGDYGRHVEGRFLGTAGEKPVTVTMDVLGSKQTFPMADYVRYYTKNGVQINTSGSLGFYNLPAILVIESVGGQEVVTEVWSPS